MTSRLNQNFKFWRQNLHPTNNSVSPPYQNLISELNSCKNSIQISRIHGYMIKTGLDQDHFALSKILASSIHYIHYLISIFNKIPNPNLFMFNCVLRGYSISDDPKQQAITVFNRLRRQDFELDQFSFVATLKSSARGFEIDSGKAIHGTVFRSGHLLFINVRNTLLHLYCVCGRIEDAHKLFEEIPQRDDDDLVSWNSLMSGYLHNSKFNTVMDLFREMSKSGLRFTLSTLLTVFSALGELQDILTGESVHGHCIKIGLFPNTNIATALIDMYARCKSIESSRMIFDNVAEKDIVLWNCMIDKYAKIGMLKDAMDLLRLMKNEQQQEVKPNSSTLVGLISAITTSNAIDIARSISDYVDHAENAEETDLIMDPILATALVNMYAKLGFLDKAVDIFDKIKSKDVKLWTSMISGYGAHGLAGKAIGLFDQMEKEEEEGCRSCRPNEVTFLAVLTACSHGGMVNDGVRCFLKMVRDYGFMPKVEHYGCMIDLLGRAGMLEEGYSVMKSLPIRGDSTGWRTLLSACRVYGNVEIGELVKEEMKEFDDEHPTDSILLSGIYAMDGSLFDRICVEEKIRKSVCKKEVGCSAIEMENQELM